MKIRPTSAIAKYTLLIFLLATTIIFPVCAKESGNRLLFGEEYFNALHKAFQQAQDSIWGQMYYMGARGETTLTFVLDDFLTLWYTCYRR